MNKDFIKRNWGKLLIAAYAILPVVILILTFIIRAFIAQPIFALFAMWVIAVAVTFLNFSDREFY